MIFREDKAWLEKKLDKAGWNEETCHCAIQYFHQYTSILEAAK
jgi:hypothetical protein